MNVRKKLSDLLVKVGLAESYEVKLQEETAGLMRRAKSVLSGKEMKTLVAAFKLTPGERVVLYKDSAYEKKVRNAMNKLLDAGFRPTDIFTCFTGQEPLIPAGLR